MVSGDAFLYYIITSSLGGMRKEGCEIHVLWWVCLSVCLFTCITQKPHCQSSPVFCVCCLRPWLRPPLMALPYVMYFQFCGWCHFCIITLWRAVFISKQRLNTTSVTAKVPTKFCSTITTVSTYCELRTWAKSAIYNCLVWPRDHTESFCNCCSLACLLRF